MRPVDRTTSNILPFLILTALFVVGFTVFGETTAASESDADPRSPSADFLIPLQNITQVKAGGVHTCALSTNGEVICWGYDEYGQTGSGTSGTIMTSSLPVRVNGLTDDIQFLAPGMFHTCVANATNAYCWGLDEQGQLGNGDKGDSLTPVKVLGLDGGIQDMDSGQAHTCVLTSTGGVQCWGKNSNGQLGDGTYIDRMMAVDVVDLGSGVMAVSVGEDHTCALLDSGEVMCWGWNGDGAVGDGTRDTRSSPVLVVGLAAKPVQITAAGYHTCALLETGQVQCWGDNQRGELGDGTTINRLTPVTVQGLTGEVEAIVTGGFFSCAQIKTGEMTCWGENRRGQLGNGTTKDSLTPTAVVGMDEPVKRMTGGDNFTCVVTVSDRVKCWGSNFIRQLGDETTIDRTSPVDVLIRVALEESLFLPTIFK